MTIKDIKIVESIKKIRPKDLVYSGILALFAVAVVIIFFISTRFISENINKVFSSEGGEGVQALNIERYNLVTKKLGITANGSPENTVALATTTPRQEVPTIVTPEKPTTPTLDKKSLTIMVRNSTIKKGVAGTLAKSLENAGFTAPTTGNESTPYSTTTILIKDSKNDYAPLVLEEISKTYSDATIATTSESAAFDVTIIIGGK